MWLIKIKNVNINNDLLFNDNNITAPHWLMELSTRDYRRVVEKSIHISGYIVAQVNNYKIGTYDDISYECLIKLIKKRTTSQWQSLWSKEINSSQMTGKYFMITVNKSEFQDDGNIISIDTRSRCLTNKKDDGKYIPSVVVV